MNTTILLLSGMLAMLGAYRLGQGAAWAIDRERGYLLEVYALWDYFYAKHSLEQSMSGLEAMVVADMFKEPAK